MYTYTNKILWRTYIFIVCFSFLAAGTFLTLKWNDIKEEAVKQQSYSNKLMDNSIANYLDKYAVSLNIIGSRLNSLLSENKLDQAAKLITKVMQESKELADIGLVSPKGELMIGSQHFNQYEIPEEKPKEISENNFLSNLENENLVVGRTYFSQSFQEWLMPLRLVLRNESGGAESVITVEIKFSDIQDEWFGNSLPDYMKLMVLRSDLYRQYVSFVGSEKYEDWLGKPLEETKFNYVKKLIYEQTGKTLEQLSANNEIVSFSAPDKEGYLHVMTVSFIDKYGYFIITGTEYAVLYQRLISPTSWLILFLAIFNVGLYLLFKSNIRTYWQAKASLQYQVEHDPLTKLPNRRYLVSHYQEWSALNQNEHSLLFLDLNNFKTCNDIHGHTTGDQILCAAADRLKEHFSDSLCARQGGDEFIVLCPITNQSMLTKKCEEFATALAKTIHVKNLEFSIYASIGVSFAPADGNTLDELLRKADMAMYEAKRRQRSLYVYTEELEAKTKHVSSIEHELVSALQNNEFSLVYQPQVDAYSYQVLGIEALLRWNNPRLGFVPPDVFIPVAEASGLINEIGHFVMEQALKDGEEIATLCALKHKLRVSVNLSVSQLFNDDFVRHLKALLDHYEGQTITFMLEVTESLFIDDLVRAKDILEQVKGCGVYVSLDDFGTGYSSLSVLSKLPINELKIDRSFVNDILTDEHDWLLAKSIIYLCKSLSIPVVAEGVENKAQADRLAAHGCDIFQGYYFSKPLAKEALIAFLKNRETAVEDESRHLG